VSVTEAAHRPARSGRTIALWIAFLVIIAAGVGLAWADAGALRPEVTASGLQFRTLKSGSGPKITKADAALLDYVLSANDGQTYDSSESHGGAQPFAMAHVYPGFAEAMSRMQDGGIYRFTIPQSIAWGSQSPTPQGWPAGSPLTFEVRVRKVVPGGAAILDQQLQQQRMQQMLEQQGMIQGSQQPGGETPQQPSEQAPQ
jgi:FKBP-type peptidyl-prolyl cis-trans isomerase FkpA